MKNLNIPKIILGFHAFTAIAGGLSLMAGKITPPESYLTNTDFNSFYLPGVILFAIVGGSAAFALLASMKKLEHADLITILSALIMLFWIVGEVISINHVNALQILYAATSVMLILKTNSANNA